MRDDRSSRHPHLELDSFSITLSSGEADFYGLVKVAGVWTDYSVALGISTRSGIGRLRHLETHTRWVHKKVRVGEIKLRKVRGDMNPADLVTKHLPSENEIHQFVQLFGCECRAEWSAVPCMVPVGVEAASPPQDTCRLSSRARCSSRTTGKRTFRSRTT